MPNWRGAVCARPTPRHSCQRYGDGDAVGVGAIVGEGAIVGLGDAFGDGAVVGVAIGVADAPGLLARGVGLAPGLQAAAKAAPTTMTAARRRFMMYLLRWDGAIFVAAVSRSGQPLEPA